MVPQDIWRYRRGVASTDVVITGFHYVCNGMSFIWDVGCLKSVGCRTNDSGQSDVLLCMKELCQMWTRFPLSLFCSRHFIFVCFTQERFSCFHRHYWYLCHTQHYDKWLSIFAQFAFHSWYVEHNTSSWFLHINQYYFHVKDGTAWSLDMLVLFSSVYLQQVSWRSTCHLSLRQWTLCCCEKVRPTFVA